MQYFAIVLLWLDTDYKRLFYLADDYVSQVLTAQETEREFPTSPAHSTRVRQPWMAAGFEHEGKRAGVRHGVEGNGLMGARLWARGLNQNRPF
jgi:hypothetical protein